MFSGHSFSDAIDARALIEKAMQQWRGTSSFSEMTMTIQRVDWQRSMSLSSWTQGDKISLVRVTQPKKDAGNSTLTKDNSMWTFAPKINRIIKIPSSMMNQNWMGSDFSNKDISKSTDIIDQYDHKILETKTLNNRTIYTIESIPHEDSAVVWGKEVLIIRDDFIMIEQQFYDQDDVLVKSMKTLKTEIFDDRTVASHIRMGKVSTPNEWTEIIITSADFNQSFPSHLFTLSNLRNPR